MNRTLLFSFICIAILGFSTEGCSTPAKAKKGKTTKIEAISQPAVTEVVNNEEVAADFQAMIPDTIKKYGEDSVECVKNLSLYNEFYKQKNIKDAIVPWRWCFFNCPVSSKNIYIHGVSIVKFMIKQEKDPAKKEKLIDTLIMVYDQREQYFSQRGFVLGRKGVDMFQYRPEKFEEAYNMLKESISLEGNKSYADVLDVYFILATKMVEEGIGEKELVIDAYDACNSIISYKIKNNTKDAETCSKVSDNIELRFEPYANCTDLVGIYEKKFNATPDDIDLLKRITRLLSKKECTEERLFFLATGALHKQEPTAESALLVGKMNIGKKQYSKAVEYFLEAAKLFKNPNDKADCYLLLGEAYRALNQFLSARTYALKAAELRPNDGRPYIIIGDLYTASAKECAENGDIKPAYWIAVDKFIKAKTVDLSPSVTEAANQRIATYRQYFPGSETLFFHSLKEGQSFLVGCWINETTTVRAK